MGPHLWWSLCVCVGGFFLWRQSCVVFLYSCWVWGRLLLASSGVAAVPFPGAPAVFRGVSCSWLPFSGYALIWLRLAGLLLQWTFSVGLVVSWYTTWFSTLCQRCLPVAGSAPFWLQFAGLLLRWSLVVGLQVSLMRRLVFYHVPRSSSGACCLRSFPCSRFPWGFSGHWVSVLLLPWWVGWASAFPFLFCASPAPAGLQGFAGFCTLCQGAPVGVVSALWTTVSSPCWLSLTLGWMSFWTAVSTVSVGCEVCGLGCPSWFVLPFMSLFVLHLLLGWGGLVTGLWPHLQLLGFGLFWSLGCTVLTP